ncbi:MAG: hypothetical protein KAR40_17685, partial [Candidatus Sabulitectum sp.]|nr:hypothetical protein [Candidatus Sabulitectum sp.]
ASYRHVGLSGKAGGYDKEGYRLTPNPTGFCGNSRYHKSAKFYFQNTLRKKTTAKPTAENPIGTIIDLMVFLTHLMFIDTAPQLILQATAYSKRLEPVYHSGTCEQDLK